MSHIISFAAILLSSLMLCGCFLPEDIEADITVHGYDLDVQMKGRVIYAYIAPDVAQGYIIPEGEEEILKRGEEELSAMPGVQSFRYIGQARYDFDIDLSQTLTPNDAIFGFPLTDNKEKSRNFLSIERSENGLITIMSPAPNAKAGADLDRIGLTVAAQVRVLTSNRVVSHNADIAPVSANEPYVWTINGWNEFVFIQIDPTQ